MMSSINTLKENNNYPRILYPGKYISRIRGKKHVSDKLKLEDFSLITSALIETLCTTAEGKWSQTKGYRCKKITTKRTGEKECKSKLNTDCLKQQ